MVVCNNPVHSVAREKRTVRSKGGDEDLSDVQVDRLATARKEQFTMSQPRREHVSECLGRVRSHCEVEMGQGESFLGFPRQFTVLFYTKILKAVTT